MRNLSGVLAYVLVPLALVALLAVVDNDIVLAEAGVGDAKSVILDKQSRFIQKLKNREDYYGSYLNFVIDLVWFVGSRKKFLLHLSLVWIVRLHSAFH